MSSGMGLKKVVGGIVEVGDGVKLPGGHSRG